jgi:hypothetical protein
MSGPKNATFEELTDEDEESCLQEELSPQAFHGRSCSTVPAELEAPGLAPVNPGSHFSSFQESPQPALQRIGRTSWLLFGRGNSHLSK